MKIQAQELQSKIDRHKKKLNTIQNLPLEAIKKYTVNSYSKLLDYHNTRVEHYKKELDALRAKTITVNDPQAL